MRCRLELVSIQMELKWGAAAQLEWGSGNAWSQTSYRDRLIVKYGLMIVTSRWIQAKLIQLKHLYIVQSWGRLYLQKDAA